MRGRYPSGPEYVEQLDGSTRAKQRLQVIMETMTGKYRVPEACRLLNICEQRFYQLRAEFLQAALERLEARPAGRRRRQLESEEVMALRTQVEELKRELQAAHVREEIALVFPNRVQAEDEPEKKKTAAAEGVSATGVVEEVTQPPPAIEPASVPVAEGQNVEPQFADSSVVPVTDTECATVGQRFREALQQTEAEHLDRLWECIRVQANSASAPCGPERQQSRRRLEQEVRRDAVDFYRRLKMQGGTLEEAAELLSMPARTLRQWDYDCRTEPLQVLPLGRPMARSEPPQRAAVLDFLKDQGAGVGVPRLRQAFPGMARAELADLVLGYRHELCAGKHDSARVLHWQVPGRVWAMDFAAPSDATGVLPAIDGQYPYLLAVRDLASGYLLCWLPVPNATAATTQRALARLFAQHGAPLVVKSDNGPAFRADETKRFLEQAGVFLLYSPPHWPGYNGAIEASIGSLKKRTERQAARHDRAGLWTMGDVEAARLQANTSHPRRLNGMTPAQTWTQRTPPSDVERVRFELTVERQRFVARSERGIEQDAVLDHWKQGKLDRKAIERALVEHDYLWFRRRRLPLTIKPGKVTYFV